MFGESSWFLRRPPLWARWVLSLGVAAIVLLAIVLWVSHHNTDNLAPQSPKAIERANRETAIVVAQLQLPHVVAVKTGAAPRAAAVHAVRAAMASRISQGLAVGPLQRVTCQRTATRGADLGLRCTALAADVKYPYQAVLNSSTHRLTFCQHDASLIPSHPIPVSRRCVV